MFPISFFFFLGCSSTSDNKDSMVEKRLFSKFQVDKLLKMFQENKYPSSVEVGELAERLKLSDQSDHLSIWDLVLEIDQSRNDAPIANVQRPMTDHPGVGDGILSDNLVTVNQPGEIEVSRRVRRFFRYREPEDVAIDDSVEWAGSGKPGSHDFQLTGYSTAKLIEHHCNLGRDGKGGADNRWVMDSDSGTLKLYGVWLLCYAI